MKTLSLSLPSPPNLAPPSSSPKASLPFSHSSSLPQLRQAISTLDLTHRYHDDTRLHHFNSFILLKACVRSGNFKLGKLIHCKLIKSGLELDSVLLSSLISLYSKCGEWETALSVFQSVGDNNIRNLVSWSAMISCFVINNMEFDALVMFLDMLEQELLPNDYCFTAAIRACSNSRFFSIGHVIFGSVLKTGYFDSGVNVGCGLIDMFVKGGNDIDSARLVFEKMPERNVATWTLMITRFAQLGCPGDAIDYLFRMLLTGYKPNRYTLAGVVSASAELRWLSLGQQIHSWAVRSGLASDVWVCCSLVDMYAKCSPDGSVENSRKVFDRMRYHDVMTWTALMTGYVHCNGQDQEAINLFHEMIQGHVVPNHFTFSSVLKACANIPDLRIGEQLHAQTVKLGLSSDDGVVDSLVSMYARSGRMECARILRARH